LNARINVKSLVQKSTVVITCKMICKLQAKSINFGRNISICLITLQVNPIRVDLYILYSYRIVSVFRKHQRIFPPRMYMAYNIKYLVKYQVIGLVVFSFC